MLCWQIIPQHGTNLSIKWGEGSLHILFSGREGGRVASHITGILNSGMFEFSMLSYSLAKVNNNLRDSLFVSGVKDLIQNA